MTRDYKTLVTDFCREYGYPVEPQIMGYGRTITEIMDRFEVGGVQAAAENRPQIGIESVRNWVLTRVTENEELAGTLADVFHGCWMDGWLAGQKGASQWTS